MKKTFIEKYDIIHTTKDFSNPLTIGNGNFAFTCDFTGLQTFYKFYTSIPLCTMSNYHWGFRPAKGEYPYEIYFKASNGAPVSYMTNTKHFNYSSYREDRFKVDIFKLGLLYKKKLLPIEQVILQEQHLYLYEAKIETTFLFQGEVIHVTTKIPQEHNNLQIHINTKLKDLELCLFFLSPDSNMQGGKNESWEYEIKEGHIKRKTNEIAYSLYYKANVEFKTSGFQLKEDSFIVLSLDDDFQDDDKMNDYFSTAKPLYTLDEELNRRMVLSLYLMKVNTLGIYPPAETGLTCNSWFGKFHLEMHLWHHLGLIRFGLYSYVLPSLRWYLSLYSSALLRAKRQGYAGLRYPKMTDPTGMDSPSPIGCLLIWQMPHLLIFLDEILKQNKHGIDFYTFLPSIIGIIDFLSSFYYEENGVYHLDSPLIPANENVEQTCDTPIFEECYTLYAFQLFKRWTKEYRIEYDCTKLDAILHGYVPFEIKNGIYEAFVGCQNTFTKYNYDHPMMVGMYSFFKSSLVNSSIIKNTLYKILECWNFDETWGWDFPMLSIVAFRLNERELALQILKKTACKNLYLKNGHNPQLPKTDLPVYLPGNGAFLLAISYIFEKN